MTEDNRAAGRIATMKYKILCQYMRLNFNDTRRQIVCQYFSPHDCTCYMGEDELTKLFRYLEELK